jgi:DinB superfamily
MPSSRIRSRIVNKAAFLSRLDRAWSGLKESYAGLSTSQMVEPGVQGQWSVRDILAHITTWEEEALLHLPLIMQGGRPPRYSTRYGGIDAFNALTTAQKKDLPLSDVLHRLDQVHVQLVEYLQAVPDELLTSETRFRRRLRLDAYGHYPKHARAIQQWRAGAGSREIHSESPDWP